MGDKVGVKVGVKFGVGRGRVKAVSGFDLRARAALELGAGHDDVELGALGSEDLGLEGGLVQDDLCVRGV